MRHIRASVLAMRLIGIILAAFSGLDIIRCLGGIILNLREGLGTIAYTGSLIRSGFWLLVGIALMIAAGIIKKKSRGQ